MAETFWSAVAILGVIGLWELVVRPLIVDKD